MEETIKNNRLIAEFWGMELGDDKTMYYDDAENLHPPTPINELKFHSSWDWLMPVVVKIKGMNIEDEEMFNEIDFYVTSSIENLYSAVVRFIEWYNNN